MQYSKENCRKCIKCRASPAQDPNIFLYRFPNPGKTNSLRCLLWAKYCFPDDSWSSEEFQKSLYTRHKMLCNKHFKKTCFIGHKLFRTAVPGENENTVTPIFGPPDPKDVFLPIAGPSRIPQPLIENINIVNTLNIKQLQQEPSVAFTEQKPQDGKEKALYMKMRKNMKRVYKLQKTVKHLKNNSFLNVLCNNDAVNNILKTKISSTSALLMQGELTNFKRKAKARRWNTEAKITALRLYKKSPTCYKLLRRMICLPAPGTLKTLLNKFNLNVGTTENIFAYLKKELKNLEPCDKEYVLMFDEMSIKKHLWYNKKQDNILGFQDHATQGRSPQVASYALVFMIAGIRKKVKQPVAYYLSSGSVSADRLTILIREVLVKCFAAGLNIAATVCDLDGVNRKALCTLGASAEHPYIKVADQEVVTIFDTPHLLKCFRNLFLKYDIKCQINISSNNKKGIGTAKWSYIKQFYDMDTSNPNFVYAPCLKQEHLNPNTKQKMKVKLAAQVLSRSVAIGINHKIATGEISSDAITTADVICNMDTLFDSVNASTKDLRRGKPLATNMKKNSGHIQFFQEMKSFFESLTFLGCRTSPPSKEGWIWTLNAIERLWKNLTEKHKCIKSLATRRIQQDPLENLFGCIRSNCGSNTNPTAEQFIAGLKTAILSNLSHISSGNCESDENEVLLNNWKAILTTSTPDICTTEHDTTNAKLPDIITPPTSFDENIDENSGEIQACAYVCGFIIKNCKNHCTKCKIIFESESQQVVHSFTEFKEYNSIKESLKYASKELIYCVENSATIINRFLEKEAYKNKLKESLHELLKRSVIWDFLDKCAEHKEYNINYVINSVFHICIKRFCILRNRKFAEETSMVALKRKIDILKHK